MLFQPQVQRVSVARKLFSGRQGMFLLVAILSVVIAASSLYMSRVSLQASLRTARSADEREARAKLLFLTGSPIHDGAALHLRAIDPNTIFRSMKVRLEFTYNVNEFDLGAGSDELGVEYLRAPIARRVEDMQKSAMYKSISESLVEGGTAQLSGEFPVLIKSEYIVAGELLEDLSLYRVEFVTSWKKGSTAKTFALTGIAFCSRIPAEERNSWLAKDTIFVGTDIGGELGPESNVHAIRLVKC